MDRCKILLDIETQRDYFVREGKCYHDTARQARPNIRKLFRWVKAEGVPVLSTVLRLRTPPGDDEAVCCVEGTRGELKLPGTLLPMRIDLGLRNTTDLPADIFETYQQVIVEKRHPDIFRHAHLERLITELPRLTFIICGATVGEGVSQAAIGLRNRDLPVVVADDAVTGGDDEATQMARLRMEAKGVLFLPTSAIVAPTNGRSRRAFRGERQPAHAR